jgi:hypothetical protein
MLLYLLDKECCHHLHGQRVHRRAVCLRGTRTSTLNIGVDTHNRGRTVNSFWDHEHHGNIIFYRHVWQCRYKIDEGRHEAAFLSSVMGANNCKLKTPHIMAIDINNRTLSDTHVRWHPFTDPLRTFTTGLYREMHTFKSGIWKRRLPVHEVFKMGGCSSSIKNSGNHRLECAQVSVLGRR